MWLECKQIETVQRNKSLGNLETGMESYSEDAASLKTPRKARRETQLWVSFTKFVLVCISLFLFPLPSELYLLPPPAAKSTFHQSRQFEHTLFKVGLRRRRSVFLPSSERLCRGTDDVTKRRQVSSSSFSSGEGREDLTLVVTSRLFILFWGDPTNVSLFTSLRSLFQWTRGPNRAAQQLLRQAFGSRFATRHFSTGPALRNLFI